MTRVIAGIDNSAAARPVLAAAGAFKELFGADLAAVHVREDGHDTARAAAEAAQVPLAVVEPPVVASLSEAARKPDVAAVVLGARSSGGGARPAGHVALELARTLSKPLLVVPPDARVAQRLRRILVPLDGSPVSAAALAETISLASNRDLSVVVLHVHDVATLPLFTEQPQHELDAWASEFLHRHVAEHERARLELRTGAPGLHVLDVAQTCQADLIALGWAQALEAGRAAVVREVLGRSSVPVLLVPIAAEPGA